MAILYQEGWFFFDKNGGLAAKYNNDDDDDDKIIWYYTKRVGSFLTRAEVYPPSIILKQASFFG